MISLLIVGHGYQHDLFELIRVFFQEKEIIFLETKDEYDKKGYLIESILDKTSTSPAALTKVSIGDKVLLSYKVHIKSIIIKDYSSKQILKLAIKKSIYNVLSNLTNKDNPWGILTGIRPNKIMHNLLDIGYSNEKAIDILERDYKLHNSKAILLSNISSIQRKHLHPIDKKKYSLYISIPFCPSICSYCSFSSLPISRYYDIVEEYVNKLISEIKATSEFMTGKKLHTVYIGGGTPTSISTLYLAKIIDAIYKYFGEHVIEFTVEAGRPDTIGKEVLIMLKEKGIHRISINPQTMEDSTLKSVGRSHSSQDVIDCFNLAKNLGFPIINMDLILGLPGEGGEEIKSTLNEISKLNPENLTIHSLSLKRGSSFKKDIYAINHINNFNINNIMNSIDSYINNMNLFPYYLYRQKQITGNMENIGYSKIGMECIYNISMMEEKETILGLGMGAVSKIYYPDSKKIRRIPNFKGISDYINRIDELIKIKKEVLS